LIKIIRNMIRTIGFRPEGRNPNNTKIFEQKQKNSPLVW
jgi:hypothetical protein